MSDDDPLAPVEWEPLVELREHTCLQCEAVFEERREEFDPGVAVEDAVERLYDAWRSSYERTTPQGAVYVFAYLLEREGLASLEGWSVVEPASLTARKPDRAELRRLFVEETETGWWLAVRYGVHYSLVQYWLYEEDVPLLRRNLTPSLLERVDERDSPPD